MNDLLQLAYWIYNYCTDFVINLANILNLSYYEVNFILFILLYPALILGTALLYLIQRWRRKQVSNSMSKFNDH
jgi:hypothetical protein